MRCVRYDGQCLLVGSMVRDLALDVERGLLYYTDYGQDVIAEITIDGSNKREIFRNSTGRPRHIVVDSTSRLTKLITTSVCHTFINQRRCDVNASNWRETSQKN